MNCKYCIRSGFFAAVLLLCGCWERQEHVVSPPSHPTYTLYGTVSRDGSDLPVAGVNISLIMTELYQGEFLDTLGTQTDTGGYYQINDLFRGRYDIHVVDEADSLFSGEVGIIKYEDKEYNIVIVFSDSSSASQ